MTAYRCFNTLLMVSHVLKNYYQIWIKYSYIIYVPRYHLIIIY